MDLGIPPIGTGPALSALAGGATLVTANRRLARAMRHAYNASRAEDGLEAWTGGDVISWEDWIHRCWEEALDAAALAPEGAAALFPEGAAAFFPEGAARVGLAGVRRLTGRQSLLVWELVISASPEGRALGSLPQLARSAQQAHSLLKSHRLPLPGPGGAAAPEFRAFAAWATAYQSRCAERGWVDGDGLPGPVAESFRAGLLPHPTRLLLAGFDRFTPLQQELLEQLTGLGAKLEVVAAPERSGGGVRTEFPDAESEIRGAARWARALLEADREVSASGEGALRIGIVVPALERRRSVIERIFADILAPPHLLAAPDAHGLPFNISLGLPLAATPLVDAALGLLALSPRPQPWEKIELLLHTPFLPGGGSERSARSLLDLRLRSGGGGAFSLARVEAVSRGSAARGSAAGDGVGGDRVSGEGAGGNGDGDGPPYRAPRLAESLARWRAAWEKQPARTRPRGWAEAFAECLKALGWPGERARNSAEFQTLGKWRELLESFAALEPVAEPLERGAALSLLARMAAEEIFQPEGGAAPVQVVGLLEAAGLEFDHLWVMGLHDEAWPPPPRLHPLLPPALQRRHGLPRSSAALQLEAAAQNLAQWRAAAPDLVLSSPASVEERPVRPSPLIRALPTVNSVTEPATLPSSTVAELCEAIAATGGLESLADDRGPPLPAGVAVAGGTALFADQAACPFRAFARHRLHAQAPPEPEDGLDPAERGGLVHRAMEKAWGRIGDHATLCALEAQELRAWLEDSAGEALKEFAAEKPDRMGARLAGLERTRLAGLLADWMELEKQRAPFRVEHRELQIGFEIGGISVTGRVDRIDRLDNGQEVILDYKTGALKTDSWMGERPDEPQLPLYCVSGDHDLAGVAFAGMKTGDLRFLGLAGDPAVFPRAKSFEEATEPGGEPFGSKAALLNHWKHVLESLGAAFRAGEAAVDPKQYPQTCEWCDLGMLCRIGDSAAPANHDPEGASGLSLTTASRSTPRGPGDE